MFCTVIIQVLFFVRHYHHYIYKTEVDFLPLCFAALQASCGFVGSVRGERWTDTRTRTADRAEAVTRGPTAGASCNAVTLAARKYQLFLLLLQPQRDSCAYV